MSTGPGVGTLELSSIAVDKGATQIEDDSTNSRIPHGLADSSWTLRFSWRKSWTGLWRLEWTGKKLEAPEREGPSISGILFPTVSGRVAAIYLARPLLDGSLRRPSFALLASGVYHPIPADRPAYPA